MARRKNNLLVCLSKFIDNLERAEAQRLKNAYTAERIRYTQIANNKQERMIQNYDDMQTIREGGLNQRSRSNDLRERYLTSQIELLTAQVEKLTLQIKAMKGLFREGEESGQTILACPDCGTIYSSHLNLKACPDCGTPLEKRIMDLRN